MLAYLDTFIGFAVVMLGASLLITVLTQMVSALFSHRGANLRWGLETMFKNLPNSPLMNTATHAEMIAKDVLTHPLISDSIFSLKPQWLADRIRLATAVHPDELFAILRDLSTKPAYTAIAGLPAEIDTLVNAQNPATGRRLALLSAVPAFAGLNPSDKVPLFEDTVKSIKDEAGQLEAWFNATMDRVSARFTTYMRVWTVAFSVALALGTGLNSVSLLSGLYKNGALRQSLAGAATPMLALGGNVLPAAGQSPVGKMYTDAVAAALTNAKLTIPLPATGITSDADARSWLTTHVTDSAQQTAVLAAYDQAIKASLDQDVKNAAQVRTILDNASFDVRKFGWQPDQPWPPQLPGVLASAALLTLGAPFWFNMLKQLTNLRPIVANKSDTPAK